MLLWDHIGTKWLLIRLEYHLRYTALILTLGCLIVHRLIWSWNGFSKPWIRTGRKIGITMCWTIRIVGWHSTTSHSSHIISTLIWNDNTKIHRKRLYFGGGQNTHQAIWSVCMKSLSINLKQNQKKISLFSSELTAEIIKNWFIRHEEYVLQAFNMNLLKCELFNVAMKL